jgi:hypothetical protein
MEGWQYKRKYTFQRGKSKSRIDLSLVGCDTANKVISRKLVAVLLVITI